MPNNFIVKLTRILIIGKVFVAKWMLMRYSYIYLLKIYDDEEVLYSIVAMFCGLYDASSSATPDSP